jgi:hypothetical protein
VGDPIIHLPLGARTRLVQQSLGGQLALVQQLPQRRGLRACALQLLGVCGELGGELGGLLRRRRRRLPLLRRVAPHLAQRQVAGRQRRRRRRRRLPPRLPE